MVWDRKAGDALQRAHAEIADLKRQNADLQRQLAAAVRQREQSESERRQWRSQASLALTMDDPEYIRDALEKLT